MSKYNLTAQEIFETVAKHLFKQAKQARKAGLAGCAYRGDDGSKCAVGFLIADEDYSEEMEGNSARGIIETSEFNEEFPADLKQFLINHEELLNRLQAMHDNMDMFGDPEEYVRKDLRGIAIRFHLDDSFVADLKWGA